MLNTTVCTPEDLALWQKIQAFQFDEPGTKFRFSDRLARENGWTKTHALRVMDEYRKFLFLSAVSPKPLTPSDAVDQAWHLHLTYTKSYWKDLCGGVLQREFHHNPTKGGEEEAQKFNGFYDYTFRQYVHYFEQDPPADIWQDAKTRFSETHYVRVKKSKRLAVDEAVNKPLLVIFAAVALFAFGVLIWVSPYFLLLTPILALLGFGVSKIMQSEGYLTPSGGDGTGNTGCGGCAGGGHDGCSGGGGCSGCGGD